MARITIAPDTGPEVIAGSTRMKAGTAQKMVLNMLSTAAMVRLGQGLRELDGGRGADKREVAPARARGFWKKQRA